MSSCSSVCVSVWVCWDLNNLKVWYVMLNHLVCWLWCPFFSAIMSKSASLWRRLKIWIWTSLHCKKCNSTFPSLRNFLSLKYKKMLFSWNYIKTIFHIVEMLRLCEFPACIAAWTNYAVTVIGLLFCCLLTSFQLFCCCFIIIVSYLLYCDVKSSSF